MPAARRPAPAAAPADWNASARDLFGLTFLIAGAMAILFALTIIMGLVMGLPMVVRVGIIGLVTSVVVAFAGLFIHGSGSR